MYKNDRVKKYKSELLLCLFLIIAPFFIYVHLLFDDESTTLNLLGFTFHHGYSSTQYFIWLTISEFSSMIFLIIIFFSIDNKWKYVLFVPLSIFMHDLFDPLNLFTNINFQIIILRYTGLALFLLCIIKLDKEYFSRKRVGSFALRLSILKRLGYVIIKKEQLDYAKNLNKGGQYFSIGNLYRLYSKRIYLKEIVDRFSVHHGIVKPLQTNRIQLLWIILVLVSVSIRIIAELVPQGISTLYAGPFTIKAYGFLDISIFIWYLSQKVMILVPLIIGYFNIRSWWRYAILSPIILYLYQFWESFQDLNSVDGNTNIKIFPLVLMSVLLVLVLSRLVKQHYLSLDTYDQITAEIDDLIQKISEERTGLSEYKKRYAQILDKLIKRNAGDLEMDELRQLEEELRAKIV